MFVRGKAQSMVEVKHQQQQVSVDIPRFSCSSDPLYIYRLAFYFSMFRFVLLTGRRGGGTLQAQTRELMRQEGEIEEERRLAAKMLAEARTTAPRLATMSSITEHRNRWVAYKVFRGGEEVSGSGCRVVVMACMAVVV